MSEINAVLQYIPFAAAILDQAGTILSTNEAFRELTAFNGVDTGRIVGIIASATDANSPWTPSGDWDQDRRELVAGVRVRLAGQRPASLRVQLVEIGDDILLCTATPLDGTVVGLLEPDKDVVAPHIVNTMLRSVDDGVCVIDSANNVACCNEIALEFVDAAIDSPTGRGIGEVFPLRQSDRRLDVGILVDRSRSRNEDLVVSSNVTITTRTGGQIEVELALFPDRTTGWTVLMLRNAGERRRVWSEVRRVQHAEDIARAAGGIAHELNNSGTTLISQLGLIDSAGEAAPRLLRDMEAAIRRVRRLAFQLERFTALPDRGRDGDTNSSYVTPERLIEVIQDTVSLAVSGSAIQTSFVIDPDLPGVAAPVGELAQAYFNVVANAVDAMSGGGSLHVEAQYRRRSDMVDLIVRDEGDGMDPRIVEDVLKPYFSTRNDKTGMGLTVAYSVIRNAGGTIEIDTNPGFGTSVTLCLPAINPESGTVARQALPTTGSGQAIDADVLLVEDDPLVRRSMERTLQTVGCRVTPVAGGEQALDAFRDRLSESESFSVLMTDLTMPGRYDGVQLLRRIRELDEDIPAVLCSGVLHRSNISEYRDAGFQTILRKPFGVHELVTALTEALQQDE